MSRMGKIFPDLCASIVPYKRGQMCIDSFKGKWESSGATEHCLECHGQFNWINPKTLSTKQPYHRRKERVIRN